MQIRLLFILFIHEKIDKLSELKLIKNNIILKEKKIWAGWKKPNSISVYCTVTWLGFSNIGNIYDLKTAKNSKVFYKRSIKRNQCSIELLF